MKNLRVVNELKAKRVAHVERLQELAAKAADSPLDGVDKGTYEKLKGTITDIDAKIADMERYNSEEREEFTDPHAENKHTGFLSFLRSGDRTGVSMQNVETTGIVAMDRGSSSAGAVVPTDLADAIWLKAIDDNPVARLCTVMNLANDTDIPISGERPKWKWTAEKGKAEESDATLTSKSLKAHKATCLTKATIELLADSKFNIESYLSARVGESFSDFLEENIVNNSASETTKPCGIKNSATEKETENVGKVTYKDIMGLYLEPKQKYRKNGTFVASKSAILNIMTLVDDSKRPIFTPSYAVGQPDMILGKPVAECGFMETDADKARNIMFGDFSAYIIGQRQQMVVQRLVELYAENGFIGFLFHMRMDGKLMDEKAIYVLKQKAAASA